MFSKSPKNEKVKPEFNKNIIVITENKYYLELVRNKLNMDIVFSD